MLWGGGAGVSWGVGCLPADVSLFIRRKQARLFLLDPRILFPFFSFSRLRVLSCSCPISLSNAVAAHVMR